MIKGIEYDSQIRNLKGGVYSYDDISGIPVYFGIDRNIQFDKRHIDHLKPSNIKDQTINKILQNTYLRYRLVAVVESKEIAEKLEKDLIKKGQPKLNKNLKKG